MLDIAVDYGIPVPISCSINTKSYMSLRERAEAACKSAIHLQGANQNLEDTGSSTEKIVNLVKKDVQNVQPNYNELHDVFSSPSAAIRINAIMHDYDHMIVENAIRIRNYVTNKLIEESANNDPKIRMQALIQLGKITDVGLFTERTEININAKTTVEITNTLRDKLASIINKDIEDADIIVDTVKDIDVGAEFKNILQDYVPKEYER